MLLHVMRRHARSHIERLSLSCRLSSGPSSKSGAPSSRASERSSNISMAYGVSAVAVLVFGLSYASVPLYKVFCQMTGFGGTTKRATESKAKTIKPVEGGKIVRIDFAAAVHDAMPWSFKPVQHSVKVVPGETALAFYTVKNPTDKPITGVATYNVHPPKAGLYFNKIQCFCFEEQRLNPREEVDMPVFFFLDPEMVTDPAMVRRHYLLILFVFVSKQSTVLCMLLTQDNVKSIVLSYTFFKTGEEEVPGAVKINGAVVQEK